MTGDGAQPGAGSPTNNGEGNGPGAARGAGPRVTVRTAVQLLAFLAGIGLLVWCVKIALNPRNQEQMARLREATAGEVALILGLSAASLLVNGATFWVMLRPVKRIGPLGVLATNALATFLNYLPFKVGVLTRVLVHRERDGVPVVTTGAWFASMAAVLAAALMPPCAATLWLRRVDWAWAGVTLAGVVALSATTVAVSRVFAGERGAGRLRAVLARLPLGARFASSKFFDQAHAGTAILAHAPTVSAGVGLRLLDLGLQAARFWVIAGALRQELEPGRALMAAVAYFLTGILSPGGMLGSREGVTAWLFGADGAQSLGAAALLVGAAELITNMSGAALGLAYLRPDRLLKGVRGRGAGKKQ